MSSPFKPSYKPFVPSAIEVLGWFVLGFVFGIIAITNSGCKGVEYTAGASVVHDDGPQHYVAKFEVSN
jgi:hypothetical protein